MLLLLSDGFELSREVVHRFPIIKHLRNVSLETSILSFVKLRLGATAFIFLSARFPPGLPLAIRSMKIFETQAIQIRDY